MADERSGEGWNTGGNGRWPRWVAGTLTTVLVAVVLSACGGSSDPIPSSEGKAADETTTTTEVSEDQALRSAVKAQFAAAVAGDAAGFLSSLALSCQGTTTVADIEGVLAEAEAAGMLDARLEIVSVDIDGAQATVTTSLIGADEDPIESQGSTEDTDSWLLEDGEWHTDDC